MNNSVVPDWPLQTCWDGDLIIHTKRLSQIREILNRNHPEATERLDRYAPAEGAIPNSYTSPEYFGLFVVESVHLLAELVDEQAKAATPKKRGRPRKAKAS